MYPLLSDLQGGQSQVFFKRKATSTIRSVIGRGSRKEESYEGEKIEREAKLLFLEVCYVKCHIEMIQKSSKS